MNDNNLQRVEFAVFELITVKFLQEIKHVLLIKLMKKLSVRFWKVVLNGNICFSQLLREQW